MTTKEARFLRLSMSIATAIMALSPVSCWAATAALTWDQTLICFVGIADHPHRSRGDWARAQRRHSSLCAWRSRPAGWPAVPICARRLHRARRRQAAELRPALNQLQSNSKPRRFEVQMKLARISRPLRSVQVRVMLTGDLNAGLERYAQY
jgi:hypothetical protein